MNKSLIVGLAAAALAVAPAAAAPLTSGAPGTTTIDIADSFASLGLVVGVLGDAAAEEDGVFVLPMTGALDGTQNSLLGGAAQGDSFMHEGSGLSLTTRDGIMASLTDLIVSDDDGVVSGMIRVENYLPNGDVLYGRMDLFSLAKVEGEMTFDMIVSGMAGETLLTYLGVDLSKENFAEAVVTASLETPLPGALALFGTALVGGAVARRRAGR